VSLAVELRWRDLWSAPSASLAGRRDLFRNLVWAELTARYKTTALGVIWFVLNPVLSMIIMVLVFRVFMRVNVPHYPVFVLSALLPWTFFQMALTNASGSIPRSSGMVKKVLIPRAMIPLSAIVASWIHFLISLTVLFILMAAMSVPFTAYILCLPAVMLLQLVFITGAGLLAASLNVFYRDIEYLLEPSMRAMFYLTPSLYPLSWVPKRFLNLYLLNPMAGIIEIYRETLVLGSFPSFALLAITSLVSLVIFVFGMIMFVRSEQYFDDYI
jgi:lipopolysaccharide transport system permease protein